VVASVKEKKGYMKIVFVTSVFYPYFDIGGAVHTYNVARWLVKFGHKVTVVCAKTCTHVDNLGYQLPNYETIEGINIIRTSKPYKYGALASSLPSMFEQYTQVRNLVNNNEADIVNPVTYRSNLPALLATNGKVPCIATIHAIVLKGRFFGFEGWKNFESSSNLSHLIGWFTERVSLSLPYSGFMVPSEWVAKDLFKYYPQKPIRTIYAGIDPEEIGEVSSDHINPHQVVFIGSVVKHKNVLDAIEAVKLARESINDLMLVIISSGGEYEDKIINICESNSHIKYYKRPERRQIFKILKESSLLIHPSESETFGIAIAEALVCGIPFVAYDVPTLREINHLMPGGLLAKYKNIADLSEKMCELINNNSLREKLAENGKKVVEAEFTWEITARRVELAFQGFLNRSK
jgi:glycosyltransferase involved in cell wall biosynthesis